MNLTAYQQKTAKAIVNIFETGRVLGDYGCLTVLHGDTGHLTYGRSQATLGSGALAQVVERYCVAPDAMLGDALRPYLTRLRNRDPGLDSAEALHRLLRKAGADQVMREVQDVFFDEKYWDPAVQACEELRIESALGATVVYDSHVHGSFRRLRQATCTEDGDITRLGEFKWLRTYAERRRKWLAKHVREELRATVYRMDALLKLMDAAAWTLSLPMTVKGCRINKAVLDGSAKEPDRTLSVQKPYLQGEDVACLQRALRFSQIDCDGVYGPRTQNAVRRFQRSMELTVDGVVGFNTWAALAGG